MVKLTIIVLCMMTVHFCHAQKHSLTSQLKGADSVLLIEHKTTPDSYVERYLGDSCLFFPLIVNGKLNPDCVVKKIVLSENDVSRLASLLSYRKDNIVEFGQCFDPHHAIILIKNGNVSYIDLCFDCKNYHTSEGINLSDIEYKTWRELYKFFKAKGITIPMDEF